MPIGVQNKAIAVKSAEGLKVLVTEDDVKNFCTMQSMTYYPHMQVDENGNQVFTERSGKKIPKTNGQKRRTIKNGIENFISLVMSELAVAKEDKEGVKHITISYKK